MLRDFGRGNPWVLATVLANELRVAGTSVWVPAWFIRADSVEQAGKRRRPVLLA